MKKGACALLAVGLTALMLSYAGPTAADKVGEVIDDWEQRNGVYLAQSVRTDLTKDFMYAKGSFMKKHPSVSGGDIDVATDPVITEYLDTLNKDADPKVFEALFSKEVLGTTAGMAYPDRKPRGRIIIEAPPLPITVYIDEERMRAGNTFIVVAGARSVRVDKPPAAPCVRRIVVEEQETERVNCEVK
jgi:hypothetical protein